MLNFAFKKLIIFLILITSVFLFTGKVAASSPPVPVGLGIKYKVTGAKRVIFQVDYKHKDKDKEYLNFTTNEDMGDILEGTLTKYVSPEDVELTYVAISENGKKSQALKTTNNWTSWPFILYTQLIPYNFKISD